MRRSSNWCIQNLHFTPQPKSGLTAKDAKGAKEAEPLITTAGFVASVGAGYLFLSLK